MGAGEGAGGAGGAWVGGSEESLVKGGATAMGAVFQRVAGRPVGEIGTDVSVGD